MLDCSMYALRKHTLAAATVAVLSCAAVSSASAADRINLAALANDSLQDEFIVKYRDGSTQRRNAGDLQKSLDRAASGLNLTHLRRTAVGADVIRAGRKLDRVQAQALMRQIAADPNVAYVEPNARMTAAFTPNDTHFGVQWGYTDAGINATQAWDVSTGTGVVVAVIDTGITSHSDLDANIIGGYDFISSITRSRDNNGRDSNPADQGDWYAAGECSQLSGNSSSWHGTHVAGTVAALTHNGKGVAGIAYNAKVVPVRVLGKCGGDTADIADAITWASGGSVSGAPVNPNPAEVINLSLGGGSSQCLQTYQAAINDAVSRGVTVVVAAGNNNGDASNITPANCNKVITVGAVDNTGARSVWNAEQQSNYGAVVDVAAPGTDIASTKNSGTTTPGSESYNYSSGTSMAAPHVAGVVALIQAKATTPKSPAEIETILKNTARAFPATPDKPIGSGIVNAKAALDSLSSTPNPSTQTYSNGTDYNIPDNNATGVLSTIAVSGRAGNAPSNAQVSVNIIHPFKGDLVVDLIAPDGSVYNLHNRTGRNGQNVTGTFTVNLSSEALNGNWKLRAVDLGAKDVGKIDTWSLVF